MLIDKADMLDALLGNFAGMDLLTDAAEGNCVVLGYVAGWLDAIGAMIDAEKKKQDERKELADALVPGEGETTVFVCPPEEERLEEDDKYERLYRAKRY